MNMSLSIRKHGAATLVSIAAAMHPHCSAAQPKGDTAFGEYLASQCTTCHQRSGQYAGIPPIVGWPDDAFIEIMNEYRHKRRPNGVMQNIAARLSDEEVAALAAYFGSLVEQKLAQ